MVDVCQATFVIILLLMLRSAFVLSKGIAAHSLQISLYFQFTFSSLISGYAYVYYLCDTSACTVWYTGSHGNLHVSWPVSHFKNTILVFHDHGAELLKTWSVLLWCYDDVPDSLLTSSRCACIAANEASDQRDQRQIHEGYICRQDKCPATR
jgi:hypothetical protein